MHRSVRPTRLAATVSPSVILGGTFPPQYGEIPTRLLLALALVGVVGVLMLACSLFPRTRQDSATAEPGEKGIR
ncbi:hypothetical protein [Streptomyces nanshensis]|uniref:Uncharacterized protein n=1 Tax=Streptomyces nanshensis TaxID=518642 RepID=A0A1E7LCC5_9ACTN|nr:hypothetical protein [Streptomyces nanshensis]OEV13814.1 hypothetical protein AN218_01905 [Streptomyces nanshensis]